MIVKKEFKKGRTLTEEQMKMLETARNRPVVYDEGSPCFTEKELDHLEMIFHKKMCKRNPA